jgi:hypothetical protein
VKTNTGIESTNRQTVGTEDIPQGADSLVIAARHAFGTGDVRLMDKNGNTFSRVRFQIETLTDGSEVYNAVLL